MQFEAIFIKEQMNIKWQSENGLSENISKIADEYRTQRNLTPIKICILGPPASGKTTIAKQLAEEYKLHHLQIKDVIDKTKYELEQLIRRHNDQEQTEEEAKVEDTDETPGEHVEEARNILEKIEEIRRDPKDLRLDDEILTQIFKMKLISPPCQNQGYILDGYPKTIDQAQSLFGAINEEEEEENTEEKKPLVNELIIPDFIYILEASNAYLRQRIMHLSEKIISGTHNTELEFKRRLKIYNDLGDDLHAGKFFEDVDRLGETISMLFTYTSDWINQISEKQVLARNGSKIDDDRSINHRNIVEKIMERIKKPHNYGLTAEEEEFLKSKQLHEKEKHEREEREEHERDEQELAKERMKKQKVWNTQLEQVQRVEYGILDAQSIPLRNYLMAHVMPTLTKALLECSQVRPDDPIDFVAEYLFKNNPQM